VTTDTERAGAPTDTGNRNEPYRALYDSVGLLDLADRGILRVSGEQSIRMINGLVSNDVRPLECGEAVFTFMLTPKGRALATLRLLPDKSSVLLDVPLACLETVVAHLAKYLPPIYARCEPVRDLRVISLVGPRSVAALQAALDATGRIARQSPASLSPLGITGLHGPGDADRGLEPDAESHPGLVVRREEPEGPGFDLYVPRAGFEPFLAGLERGVRDQGGTVVDSATHQIWRVEHGIPEYGIDIGPDNLPQETGLEERTISYQKGCYTGQEVVARIHYRGHVNRRLQGLRFAAAQPPPQPPEAGLELFLEGRAVGSITSSVLSPLLGPIGLGYVRREIESGSLLAAAAEAEPTIETSDLPFTLA
jgi:folate-binding protein YgfZ